MTLNTRLRALLALIVCAAAMRATAQVTPSTTSLTFGPHTPGNSSASQSITLSNNGSTDITVTSVAASGGFSESSDCSTLRPGQSCSVDVKFISSIVGSAKGVVTITDNVNSAPHIVNLTGTVNPPISLVPDLLSFSAVAVGTGQTKTVVISNNGSSFGIRAITVSGDYTQTNNCPTTLAGGQTCLVNVTFRPKTDGLRAGVLSIESMDAGFLNPLSGFTASLSGIGTGVAPASHVSLQPAALSFGVKTPFDVSTLAQTVTLTNTSAITSLTIQNVSALGPISDANPLYKIESTNCTGMLAPGAQCTIQVLQSPPVGAPAPGTAAGSVMIVDSDNTSPHVVPLGASIQPEVRFSPGSLNFPPQAIGTTSASAIVTVTSNVDESGLALIPLAISGDFNLVSAGARPCGAKPGFTPGQSCTVGITFTPHKAGPVNGAVTFTLYPECNPESVVILHQACENAQVINLSGTGK